MSGCGVLLFQRNSTATMEELSPSPGTVSNYLLALRHGYSVRVTLRYMEAVLHSLSFVLIFIATLGNSSKGENIACKLYCLLKCLWNCTFSSVCC